MSSLTLNFSIRSVNLLVSLLSPYSLRIGSANWSQNCRDISRLVFCIEVAAMKLPGSMIDTLTLKRAISNRRTSENASTPCLVMQYELKNMDGRRPKMEATFTTRPRPLRMSGRNDFVTRTTPHKFTAACYSRIINCFQV